MSITQNLLAGLAGAATLNIIHESLKKTGWDMPRVDLVGEETVQKIMGAFGKQINNEDDLYKVTLAADLISNAIYYSVIGAAKGKYIMPAAAAVGLIGGIGAVALPKPMGLNPQPVNKTNKTRVLTVGYYLIGGLVAGAIIKSVSKK